MGRLSIADSQAVLPSERGSPWNERANRTSPWTRLRRMMRAWLESARTGSAEAMANAASRRSKARAETLEFMESPLPGMENDVQRLDEIVECAVAPAPHAGDGLAGGVRRQGWPKSGRRECARL